MNTLDFFANIYSFPAQNATSHKVTDVFSFYNLPSTIINNEKHKHLKVNTILKIDIWFMTRLRVFFCQFLFLFFVCLYLRMKSTLVCLR